MMISKLLIIAPHQDDEVVGCGGLIQTVLKKNGRVYILFGTPAPDKSFKYDKSKDTYNSYDGKKRTEETASATEILSGNNNVIQYHYLFEQTLHHKLDSIPISEIITKIENTVIQFKPDAIAYPFPSYDQDHEIVNRASASVMRPHFYNGISLEFEIVGENAFPANFFVPMSEEELKNKIKAFHCYHTQKSDPIHQVSENGLLNKAQQRGREIYSKYAEAFHLNRIVWK
jgi:LmbE family N-acetylglucosaminyl deacetylase